MERRQAVDVPPRTARAVAVAALVALVGVYTVGAIDRPADAAAAVPVAGAILLLQFRFVLAPLRRLQTPAWTAAQGVLSFVAVLCLGFSVAVLVVWVGGLLLARNRVTAAVAAVAVLVLAVVRGDGAGGSADAAITAGLMTTVVYGLSRLVGRIEEVFAARLSLAVAAVEEERLRVAAELNAGVGRGLDAIAAARGVADLDRVSRVARRSLTAARTAAVDLRSLSLTPEIAAARGMLAAADVEVTVRVGHREPLGRAGALLATVLREAVTDVVRRRRARHCAIETGERGGLLVLRVTDDGAAAAGWAAEALAPLAAQVERVGGHLRTTLEPDGRCVVEAAVRAAPEPRAEVSSAEHRLSVVLLAAVLAGFCVKGLLLLASPVELLIAVPCLAAVSVLQLGWARRPEGSWWALAAQALLSFVPLLWLGKAWGGVPGFLVGTLLLALPAAVAWPLTGAVMAAMGVVAWRLGEAADVVVNSVISVLVTGLVVWGLVRLAQLADELRAAAAGLARAAVVQERLRAARDLHDLLGHSLAAVQLKAEIARRLLASDPDRARAEFDDLVRIAEHARRDMGVVTGAAGRLELEPELASARSVLAAAGIEVRVVRDGTPPGDAEGVLSVVLREAVTNILRHSAARHCEITVGAARLTVVNDGRPDEVTPPGAGIGNLATRLAEAGGRLEARPAAGGRFRLAAYLEPAGLAGDADGVGAPPGVELGDDRGEMVADGPRRQV
ncbi:histidine kinase [Actinomadura geliboluensis]|uniref:Two-component sensor histidine kinase n=1 Tax=Actinomadura geliboluensis TaxID=882440 RepID=A0A5S4GD76_9ACTN|nr:histidine kinase [Actinomadura geliboluensis]TMR30819.1 two-component sensor histidine kinase [Actinomadura geliboluensis]